MSSRVSVKPTAEQATSSESILQDELHWFISDIMTPRLQDMVNRMLECTTVLSGQDAQYETNLALSQAQKEALKGVITRNGPKLTRGDLQIRLPPFNRGSLFKTSICTGSFYFLDQIYDARNHLLAAIEEVESYTAWTPDAAYTVVPDLSDQISKAIAALSQLNPSKAFPYKVCDSRLFDPALEADLAIEFSVKARSVVASVYALRYINPGHGGFGSGSGVSLPDVLSNTRLLPNLHFGKSNTSKNPTFKYRGKSATIESSFTIEALDPSLAKVADILAALDEDAKNLQTRLDILKATMQSSQM